MTAPEVHIDVLAIPDRVDGAALRLCLQLTPSVATCLGGPVPLDAWPAAIAARGEVRIWAADLVDGAPQNVRAVGVFTTDLPALAALRGASGGRSVGDAALAKWREIFQVPGFDALHAELKEQNGGAVAQCVAAAKPAGVASIQSALFDRLLDEGLRHATLSGFESGPGGASQAALDDVVTRDSFQLAAQADKGRRGAEIVAARLMDTERRLSSVHQEVLGICSARTAAKPALAATALQAALAELGAVLQADQPPDPMSMPPEERVPGPGESALRKLNSLLAYPTLAKYLGLCADLLLPADALGAGDFKGLIAAEIKAPGTAFGGQPDTSALSWTAVAIRVPAGRKRRWFGPWDGAGARGASEPLSPLDADLYHDGLLNLRQRVGGEKTFHLGSGDVASTMTQLAAKVTAPGDPATPSAAIERRTAGLVLYQENAAERVALEGRREARQIALCGSGGTTINFADELRHGLRFDVQLLKAVGPREPARWRPLNARTVQLSPTDVDPAFLADTRVRSVSYRDDGVSITPVAEHAGGTNPLVVAMQELMVWGGGSLAVAATPQEATIDPATDLPVSITFGLPAAAGGGARLLPAPLRVARRYALRARVALPLGCGTTFDDAQADPAGDAETLPQDPGSEQGYLFRRYEKVGAPVVALHWASPLVKSPEGGAPSEGGRSIEQMVVTEDRTSDIRYVLPPRLSLDEAEQQGQFDEPRFATMKVPDGAFEGGCPIVLYGPDGQLPEARAGGISWFDRGTGKVVAEAGGPDAERLAKAQTRGAVIVMSDAARRSQRRLYDRPDAPQPRYYPDVFARQMIAAFAPVPKFTPPSPTTAGAVKLQFWKPKERPRDARPMQVELIRGKEDAKRPVRTSLGSAVLVTPDGRNVDIPKLTVTLQPGDSVDLELFADPKQADFRAAHHAAALVADLGDYRADAAWSTARKQLCSVRTIRLVHAVRKPSERPRFTPSGTQPVLKATSVTVAPEDADGAGRRKWSEIVRSGRLESEEGGSTTFFTGKISLHGRTTGQVRCETRWRDYGPATIKRDPNTGHWIEDVPLRYAELFSIDNIASPLRTLPLDLERDEDGHFRSLAHAFQDGRTRRLRPRLVATSRFTNHYAQPMAREGTIGEEGTFERASHAFADAPEIWTDCTFRPPPPIVDRVLPMLGWTFGPSPSSRLRFERRSWLRLSLDPSWYASGEGEMLAIVFDQTPRALCDEDMPERRPYRPFLTRWGRDAIRLTRAVETLTREQIHGGEPVDGLTLHLAAGASKIVPHEVKIKAFKPVLDPVLGLHCDIRIGPDVNLSDTYLRSFSPFVQLGLARYQPNALRELRLSHPVQCMAQLLPDRLGYVDVSKIGSRKITVHVAGPVFGTANVNGGPRLSVRLMQRREPDEGAAGWFPVEGIEANKLDQQVTSTDDGLPAWSIELTLPASHLNNHYGVLIEEHELLPADRPDLVQGAPRNADPLADTVMTKRGPVFMVTVDLRQ
ncbi:hypothetical protein ACH0BU_12765 [Sphingomonas olei]